jgi:hypothetical protein
MRQLLNDETCATTTPARELRCPWCGLSLEVGGTSEQWQVRYEMHDWKRLCATPSLGGPSACLLLKDAAAGRAAERGGH